MIPHWSKVLKLTLLSSLLFVCGCATKPRSGGDELPGWALGDFQRPEGINPVITPDPSVKFLCPMRSEMVGWMESDTFNPASVEIDGKIAVIFRAEDNSAQGIGSRTSRLGLALSEDGVTMEISPEPVMFPGHSDGGWHLCDDVHILEPQGSPALRRDIKGFTRLDKARARIRKGL